MWPWLDGGPSSGAGLLIGLCLILWGECEISVCDGERVHAVVTFEQVQCCVAADDVNFSQQSTAGKHAR